MTTNQRVTDFSIAAILAEDINRHIVDPVFPCVNCNKCFTSSVYLGRHEKACYMKDGPRVTVQPDKAPTDMSSLRQVQDGRTVYQCPYCQYQTKFKGSVRYHLMTHTGERPFKCHVCGKGFKQKTDLNNHIRTHTGERPYKCSRCDYSSTQSTTLNSHVATKHTGKRIYACSLCNFSTASSSSKRSHDKVHIGEKPYHCPYCRYSAKEKNNMSLNNHIERKHIGKNNN